MKHRQEILAAGLVMCTPATAALPQPSLELLRLTRLSDDDTHARRSELGLHVIEAQQTHVDTNILVQQAGRGPMSMHSIMQVHDA